MPCTASALVALHLVDRPRSADLVEAGVGWLLSARNADGGWATIAGRPSDFAATSAAMAALHLIAPQESEDVVRTGFEVLERWGGVAGYPDTAITQMAGLAFSLAGLYDAADIPRMPTEMLLLPGSLRRRVLSFLTVPFAAHALLQAKQRPGNALTRAIDRVTRPTALRLLTEITEQEGGVGSFGADPWLSALVCTALSINGVRPDLVAATVDYLRLTVQPDGSWQTLHGMQVEKVEVTGPAYVASALGAAGLATDPRLSRARSWLGDFQQRKGFPAYDCPPGGWTWSGAQGWPNVLDSLAVLKALAQDEKDTAAAQRLRTGVDWLLERQDRRGSWSTFVRNSLLPADGPCPFSTAEAALLLLDLNDGRGDPRADRAIRWLLRHPNPDGSYSATWHRGGVAATAVAWRAFSRAGLAGHPVAARARDWLLNAQQPDGSWGTPEETGWALRALVGTGAEDATRRAVSWLVENQRADGSWRPGETGVYIRDHVHYPDHMIAQGLVLEALVAYRDEERR
ncbi:prenyltransferase/squalene oxidase repeat-containing protein [Streptomyces sp. NPDC048277]|uniref:prenyltransferase/squalene oxidase repeat-containing protein n=1 Tax=Streptomyces sp. NPDC048277 TaxID=3155027 RepID=UPI0033DCDC57